MNDARRLVTRVAHAVLLLLVLGATGELAARADDWWFQGVPFLATPSYNDLFMVDEDGLRRGKPESHYQKWHMNSFGFRGAEISRKPTIGTDRVMLLGASEAFGLYESPDREIAAQLGSLGKPYGIEVVNAALPGITIATLDNYWRNWASQFQPDTVIIYPSTHLYLTCEDWHESASPSAGVEANHFGIADLRLYELARNVIVQPEFLIRRRNEAKVEAEVARHPAGWVYQSPPHACVTRLQDDLRGLVRDVLSSGARVILCTHAVRVSRQPGEDDLHDLESFRVFSPRAPAAVMNAFVTEANAAIRALASEQHVRLVDIENEMRGKRSAFEDLVHFNDRGAHSVAQVLLDELRRSGAAR
jgi:hypothetical protein